MSSIKSFLSLTLLVACLGFTGAAAQCPAGWTAAGPINVPIETPCGVIVVQVWYCYLNGTYPDPDCQIQIQRICVSCVGMSEAQEFDAVIDALSNSKNLLGLSTTDPDRFCPLLRTWTFSRPMCTSRITGCVAACGNVDWKCTRTYNACWNKDSSPPGWDITYVSTVESGIATGPCGPTCITGTCP